MIISYLGGKLTHRFCLVCRQKVSKYFQQITSVMWDHAKDVSKRLTNHKEIRNDIKPKNRNYIRILVFKYLQRKQNIFYNMSTIKNLARIIWVAIGYVYRK